MQLSKKALRGWRYARAQHELLADSRGERIETRCGMFDLRHPGWGGIVPRSTAASKMDLLRSLEDLAPSTCHIILRRDEWISQRRKKNNDEMDLASGLMAGLARTVSMEPLAPGSGLEVRTQ